MATFLTLSLLLFFVYRPEICLHCFTTYYRLIPHYSFLTSHSSPLPYLSPFFLCIVLKFVYILLLTTGSFLITHSSPLTPHLYLTSPLFSFCIVLKFVYILLLTTTVSFFIPHYSFLITHSSPLTSHSSPLPLPPTNLRITFYLHWNIIGGFLGFD